MPGGIPGGVPGGMPGGMGGLGKLSYIRAAFAYGGVY